MRVGVIFPSLEIFDPIAVRDYVQAAEGLGYAHLTLWEHVLGIDHATRPDWTETNTLQGIHEPFVFLGYLAALTERIELATGVVVLPQRQTGVVAKQAAEIDVLSRGRLRLGVGVGWVEPEFDALGADYRSRGRRIEEQIAVLRQLWTSDVTTFSGQWDAIDRLGIRPLPVQRPIPLWLGGDSDRTLQRIARSGDGWVIFNTAAATRRSGQIEQLHTYAHAVGREPSTVGVEGFVEYPAGTAGSTPAVSLDDCRRELDAWTTLGATHVSLNTMDPRLHSRDVVDGSLAASVGRHIDALRRFREIF